jgi:polyisoprenoid-binding protein YceI
MSRRFLLPLLLLVSPPAAADDTRWRLDTVHTQIQFSIDHQGFNRSLGQFKVRDGALIFDEKDWSSARVTASIETASLYLGDAKWEETVRSWRYLNSERWPLAHFRSVSVQRGDGNSGVIHGELELHGQRRPLDLAFRLNKLGNDPYTFKRTVGFSATATLRRSDFGMDKVLSAVGDEVQLRLEVTAVRDKNADLGDPASSGTDDHSSTPAHEQDGNDGTEKR